MFSNVKPGFFRKIFDATRYESTLVREMTSEFDSSPRGTKYYIGDVLMDNGQLKYFGYAIRPDGELVYVFSQTPGMGANIMASALANGAVYLDCFDGYLVQLYSRFGFREVKRVSNWLAGGPSVVYMALPGYADRHGVEEVEVAS